MANRRFQRMQSLEREVKKLYARITTDGSGDVVSIKGVGVESVSHASNVYTIVLEDRYVEFLGASAISGVSASWHVDSETVSSDKEVVVEASAAQASTVVYVELNLKNTTVER